MEFPKYPVEVKRRWPPRLRTVLGGATLAAAGYAGGVSATNMLPAQADVGDISVSASLGLAQHDRVEAVTTLGTATAHFDGNWAPSINITPQVQPTIINNFAENGTAVVPTAEAINTTIVDLRNQLALKFGLGVAITDAILMAGYAFGRGRLSKNSLLASSVAFASTLSFTAGTAATTYTADNYTTYNVDGVANTALKQGKLTLDGLQKSSAQLQPYAASWVALQEALAQKFEAASGAEFHPNGLKLLLVSDIHGVNDMELIQSLVDETGADAVIDTGDLLNFGYPEEAEAVGIFDAIGKLTVPYIFVRGNHDANSPYDEALRARLARVPNVVLLQPSGRQFNEVVFGSVTIGGVDDPRYFGDDNKDNRGKQQPSIDQFVAAYGDRPPTIAVTHEPAAAAKLPKGFLSLSGHNHKDEVDGSNIISGSLSAGGPFGNREAVASYSLLTFDGITCDAQLETTRLSGTRAGTPQEIGRSITKLTRPNELELPNCGESTMQVRPVDLPDNWQALVTPSATP